MTRLLLLLAGLAGCASHAPDSPTGPPMQRTARQCELGVVVESIDAGPYTYVRYRAGEQEHWLAALHTAPTPGQAAGFVRFGQQTDFRSARLSRTFEVLYFGYLGTCAEAQETP